MGGMKSRSGRSGSHRRRLHRRLSRPWAASSGRRACGGACGAPAGGDAAAGRRTRDPAGGDRLSRVLADPFDRCGRRRDARRHPCGDRDSRTRGRQIRAVAEADGTQRTECRDILVRRRPRTRHSPSVSCIAISPKSTGCAGCSTGEALGSIHTIRLRNATPGADWNDWFYAPERVSGRCRHAAWRPRHRSLPASLRPDRGSLPPACAHRGRNGG